MQWYKHESNDRNRIEAKLIRARFGAEGYGIYQALIEVVAEYIEKGTFGKWGHIHPLHDIDTLAIECSTTPERLKEFLAYCDEKKIFSKDDHGLYYPLINERLDEFTSKVEKEIAKKGKITKKEIESKSDPASLPIESRPAPDPIGKEEKRKEEKRKEDIKPVVENEFSTVVENSSDSPAKLRARQIANSLKHKTGSSPP